ncbi:hypothetical protein [Cytobacillus sp. IB215316]|uniref:hypothetical protein n=1 Tax=Cytobacillus sp. IB215316 TaxID=3097354 RepID=UPI002A0DC356|nr:hypothetical protein [Cytobacillus sp. IB215316]MDX8360506.1 hypothetical protein [Cytobacillus sp. IB215316]
MIWLIILKVLVILLGLHFLITGYKMNKNSQKNEEFISPNTYYNASLSETVVIFLISRILKVIPIWLLKFILLLFGIISIFIGIFIVPLQ